MKEKVNFFILNSDGELEGKITFESLADIDALIDRLAECRAEFEHRIEMNKMKAREKRMRRKKNMNGAIKKGDISYNLKRAEELYEELDSDLKPFCKPLLDMAKDLVEKIKK